ncbi:hypothetical protein SAMN04487819_1361, partial [Actinopolyspora alba]
MPVPGQYSGAIRPAPHGHGTDHGMGAEHTLCTVEITARGGVSPRELSVESIPGAAAAVAELVAEYDGLTARWKPHERADPTHAYAFVAVAGAVHLARFTPGVFVRLVEYTACGLSYETRSDPLRFDQRSPTAFGPCGHCLDQWRQTYDGTARRQPHP